MRTGSAVALRFRAGWVAVLTLFLTSCGRAERAREAAVEAASTSALRTSERQARLGGRNPNAAAGVSSHEFGTTVDLSYAAFAPPAERPPEILARVPADLAPHVERIVDLALESVSGRKSRELGAIFSRVLLEAQSEGLALVIYERQQTVYHVTMGGGPRRSSRSGWPWRHWGLTPGSFRQRNGTPARISAPSSTGCAPPTQIQPMT